MPVSGAIVASGVLAAGATAATFAGATTLALVLSLVSYGLSTYAKLKLKDRARKATDTVSGTQEALPVVYGTRRVGGRVIDVRVNDAAADRRYLDYVCALSVAPEHGNGVEGALKLWLDDTLAVQNGLAEGDNTGGGALGTTTNTTGNFNDKVFYNFMTGRDDQDVISRLNDKFSSEWDSDSDLSGICYIHLVLEWDEDVWNGVPDVEVELQGNTVLDPRTDSHSFSTNPILCATDYALSEKYGMGMNAGNRLNDSGREFSGTSATYHTYYSNKSVSDLGLEAGDNVSLAADLKSSTGSDTTQIVLESYDSSNTLLDTKTASVTASSYSRVQFEGYSLPSNTDNITVYAENVDTTETAYVRRATLVQSSSSVGYFERFDTSSITSEANWCENTSDSNVNTTNRFALNGVIETERNLRTNIQEILTSCRGQLLYDMGTLRFHIPRSKSAESYVIDEDDIIGDYSWKRQGISDTANAVVASYVDANHSYQARDKKWPEPGNENVALNEEDSGFRNVKSIDLPHTTNREMAGRIAQVLFSEIREDVSVSFRATPEILRFEVGDVVQHSHDAEGWSQKKFWVANLGLNPDGSVTVGLTEYSDSAYNLSSQSTDTAVPGTNLPDPTPNSFRNFNADINDDGTVWTKVWGDKATESIKIEYTGGISSATETHTADATKVTHTSTGTVAEGNTVTVTAYLYSSTGQNGRPLSDDIQLTRGSATTTAASKTPDVYANVQSSTWSRAADNQVSVDIDLEVVGEAHPESGSPSMEVRYRTVEDGTASSWSNWQTSPHVFTITWSSRNPVKDVHIQSRDTGVSGSPKSSIESWQQAVPKEGATDPTSTDGGKIDDTIPTSTGGGIFLKGQPSDPDDATSVPLSGSGNVDLELERPTQNRLNTDAGKEQTLT